ncbi:MAG: ferrous iron transport protein A [Fibrobacter sp.]|nr:ferrous iron transport protein A [Fibrobacter sp.]
MKKSAVMDLSSCMEGDLVKIVRIRGDSLIRKRLIEMGFLRGRVLKIVKYAPLKDPVEVEVGGSHVSLRVCEAAGIDVEPVY